MFYLGKLIESYQSSNMIIVKITFTFAFSAWHPFAQNAPEEQRTRVQVIWTPGRGDGASAQLATFFF